MIYVITGYLGAGKSLVATQRLIDYASQGRRVAANYHVDFSPICTDPKSKLSSTVMTVLPSVPSSQDLLALGLGGTTEENAGALILDEAAQFLNSRAWQGDDRQNMINWLLHARKRFWDVFLIVQHERMLDKQVREALAEYVVVVRRTDRMKIPFLPVKMPRVHIGVVRYGLDKNSFVADRWFTRGIEPVKCYNSYYVFDGDEKPVYSVIPNKYISRWYPKKLGYDFSIIPLEFFRSLVFISSFITLQKPLKCSFPLALPPSKSIPLPLPLKKSYNPPQRLIPTSFVVDGFRVFSL